jgi:hypothetical protein
LPAATWLREALKSPFEATAGNMRQGRRFRGILKILVSALKMLNFFYPGLPVHPVEFPKQ